jgi:hypothetical protein
MNLRGLIGFVLSGGAVLFSQTYLDTLPLGHYFDGPLDNPLSRLASDPTEKLDLPGLLKKLDINTDSQVLAFAKDSFQAAKISPRNPRAIYFNDQVAVGMVPGGDEFEVAAADPVQGVVFYTFEPANQKFTRQEVCLKCHQGPATLGVPGFFVGSVFPSFNGQPAKDGAIITDQRTAFADRWGGWFVNAAHGEQPDRANAVAPDPAEPLTLEKLRVKFDATKYLSPTSDIVALMTLEHQTQMTNYLTRLKWKPDFDIQPAVDYMLFKDEAPFKEPIEGVSSFTKTFPLRGPRDRKGRSLRDFDLQTRLFRYPVSYLIYSPQFAALPETLQNRICEGIRQAVSTDTLEILRDTTSFQAFR